MITTQHSLTENFKAVQKAGKTLVQLSERTGK